MSVEEGGEVARATMRRLSSPRLVARDTELDLLASVVSQPPAVVMVEGEAGVGKSRLVDELHHRVEGQTPVLVGRCHPQRDPFPLEALIEALGHVKPQLRVAELGAVTGRLRPLLPELAELLPPEPEAHEGPGSQAHQVFRGFRELLGAFGRTVVVLDDLHWADDTTAELLHFLVASPPPELCLVLTYRTEDLPAGSTLRSLASRLPSHTNHARISLSPLRPEAVVELVEAILGTEEVSEEFAGFLHSRTGGVPFAIEELLALLRDRQDLVRKHGRWTRRQLDRIEVPAAIREAIVERLAQLSVPARRVVSAVAVAGEATTEDAAGGAAELEPAQLSDAVAEALEAGLLFERPDGFYFRHELARQALYEAISAPHRRRMHLRLAEVRASDPSFPAARLAHHFRQGGRLAEWAIHAERAADQAMARFDEAGACRILEQLLSEESLESGERVGLAQKLGRAAMRSLVPGVSAQVLRQVLDREGPRLPRDVAAELRFFLGNVLARAGEAIAGRAEVRRALPDLRATATRVSAMVLLANPAVGEDTVAEHERWMGMALETAAGASASGALSMAHDHKCTYLWLVGDPSAQEAIDARAAPRPTPFGQRNHIRWLANLAKCAVLVGHYREARSLADDAAEACNKLDFAEPLPALGATQVLCDWWTGRWEGLAEKADKLLVDPRDTPHHRPMAALARHWLGLSRDEAGAERGLLETMELGLVRGLLPLHTAAAGALAAARVELRPDEALSSSSSAVEVLRRKGIWAWGGEVVPATIAALVALGQIEPAGELVEEFARGLVGREAPAAQAALPLCRGLVAQGRGEWEEAAARFLDAEAAWSALPRPFDAALAAERAGRALVDADEGRGLEQLSSALDRFHELGASRDAARVRQVLRQHGVTMPSRRGRRGFGEALSPREEEILALADEGQTYREIAERLFLSPRTVQGHLMRARRKQYR